MLRLSKLIPLPPPKQKENGPGKLPGSADISVKIVCSDALSSQESHDTENSNPFYCSRDSIFPGLVEQKPRKKFMPLLVLPRKPPAVTTTPTFIHCYESLQVDDLRPRTQGALLQPAGSGHLSTMSQPFLSPKRDSVVSVTNRQRVKIFKPTTQMGNESSSNLIRRDNFQQKAPVKSRIPVQASALKNKLDSCKRNGVRLPTLARAVSALLSLCNIVTVRRSRGIESLAAMAAMRTQGGSIRMRGLPLSPLTTHADQGARDEICCVAPGLWQTNWRGAERRDEMLDLKVSSVLSALSGAEGSGEAAFPGTFEYMSVEVEDSDDQDLRPYLAAAVAFVRAGPDFEDSGGQAWGGHRTRCKGRMFGPLCGGSLAELGRCACISDARVPIYAATHGECKGLLIFGVYTNKKIAANSGEGTLPEALEAFVALRERRPICWPNPGFMRQLIVVEGETLGGIKSLTAEEYAAWAESNQDGVDLARFVDRDRVSRVK